MGRKYIPRTEEGVRSLQLPGPAFRSIGGHVFSIISSNSILPIVPYTLNEWLFCARYYVGWTLDTPPYMNFGNMGWFFGHLIVKQSKSWYLVLIFCLVLLENHLTIYHLSLFLSLSIYCCWYLEISRHLLKTLFKFIMECYCSRGYLELFLVFSIFLHYSN